MFELSLQVLKGDTCHNQNRDWIIYHQLVEDWYQLLTDTLGDRIQASTASTC